MSGMLDGLIPQKPKKEDSINLGKPPAKEHLSYYVAPDERLILDGLQSRLRREITGAKRRETAYSAIIQTALEIALEDVQNNGANSQIVTRLHAKILKQRENV